MANSSRSYDRVAVVVDWLSGLAGGEGVARKSRDLALDQIHERNRRTLAELESALVKFDQDSPGGGSSAPSGGIGSTQRTGGSGLTRDRLAEAGLRETDSRILRRIIEDYDGLAKADKCGAPCAEVMDKLLKRLRKIQ